MNKQILSILTAGLALVSSLNAAPNFVQIATLPGNSTVNGTKVTLIRTSQRWTADNVYILSNLTFVESPAVLTIEPGTIIRMEEKLSGGTSITDPADPGTLIICRGAKIIANGTAESPIVFTSIDDPYVAGGAATIPTTQNGSALTAKTYTNNGRFSRDSLCGGVMVLGSSNLGFGSPGTSGSIVIAVDNGGLGYESAPAVTVADAPTVANTAAASSVLGTVGRVNRVAFTQRGLFDSSSSGAVTFTAGGGVTPTSSATGTYNMRAASGRVTAITIDNGGSGYKVTAGLTL